MNPIDLNTLAAGRFRLALDEAASIEPGGKKDPWYQIIPCRYGQIYPYSDILLAIHVRGNGAKRRLAEIPGITINNRSDDGEAIFLFAPELFNHVAEIVQPKRKRRLSEAHRQKLAEVGTRALKLCQKSNSKCSKRGQEQAIAKELISEVGQSR